MGPEWVIVGIIAVVVLFGAKKLPEMARSVGRAQGEFKKGLKDGAMEDEAKPAETPAPTEPKPDATTES